MSKAEADDEAADVTAQLGTAAHEIKNALGPLAMTLQLVERQAQAGQPVGLADLGFARAQVRRLSRLVEDLMDITRADLDRLPIQPVAGDLGAMVAEAVDAFRRGHGGEVTLAQPATPLRALVDPARLHQVLLNLLENAARYSPAGAPIAVAVARSSGSTGSTARISVTDRGRGVAPDERDRIFDRFTRGGAAEGTRGLGLGLYLCRRIVEGHHGAIGVEGAAGGGATFWVDLPLET